MSESGKNLPFTFEELELLAVIVSKISARISQLMTKYPPETLAKMGPKKLANSERVRRIVLLANKVLNPSESRVNNTMEGQDLKEILKEICQPETQDEIDTLSSWTGVKKTSVSSKEQTIIMKYFRERGVAETIVRKKNLKDEGLYRSNGRSGPPSLTRLNKQSIKIVKLLSRREAIEFVINSLLGSKVLVIAYWYYLAAFFYMIRDLPESEITKFTEFTKRLGSNYYHPISLQNMLSLKPVLASCSNLQLVLAAKALTTHLVKTDAFDKLNHILLIEAFFRLNKRVF